MLDQGYASNHEMEVLGQTTEGMQAFAKRYQISLGDPKLKQMYDYEMSAKRDFASSILTAKNEAKAEMIRSFWANGAPIELIYNSAGLPRSEVDAIIAEMK